MLLTISPNSETVVPMAMAGPVLNESAKAREKDV